MRVRTLAVALALLLGAAGTARAQLTSGNITGTVTDQQGGVLPGVAVTVQGVDATQTFITDAEGKYRFLNLAPGPYKVTAGLQGFTTIIRENVIVEVGKNVELPIQMKLAAVAETITVTGESPIVDTTKTGTATNFTSDELTRIPTSRDPFALMRTVPGVLVDRVNIAGNETGQQSNFMSKGTRPADAVWTMDGVNITDMAATGASPTYYNFDLFDEIQVSTSGQDIKQPTGGLGINMVVKRGTNQYKGLVRGFFTKDSLEACNVPAERSAAGVTCDTADHNNQISDYGLEFGGPIFKDKAWFFGSYSVQDIRLVRSSGNFIDRTQLKNPDVKLNWQATKKDMVSFLYFDGFKVKDGRSPGTAGIIYDAPTATFHQDNAYTDNKLHGLWKIEDNHVFGGTMFVTGRAAFYNTGFTLAPEGGMDQLAGQSQVLARSFGSTSQSLNVRPQHTYNADANNFFTGAGGSHNIKYGLGFRLTDATSRTIWPGNMILAEENSATDHRARVYRTGNGTNRAEYLDFYVGDTLAAGRATIDVGVRYDRQWGKAVASSTVSNPAFSASLPGISFAGYESPFTWRDMSPRAGITYSLSDAHKTVAHASFSRYAGQLDPGTVGYLNLASGAGWAEYPWNDLNGDHLAQANEVTITPTPLSFGGSFNPANPTGVVSPNKIDPNLSALRTTSVVAGATHELLPNLAVTLDYSYTRTSNWNYTPWVGLSLSDYLPLSTVTGTIPVFNAAYSIPVYQPNPALITANGNAKIETNIPGYYTYYNGLELQVVKRMSNKWMARVGASFNGANEHYDVKTNTQVNGNITSTDTSPLISGGIYAPRSSGSGAGDIFVNAKWAVNGNVLYQLPWRMDAAVNVFGRQGYPFPVFRQTSLGQDGSNRVLVSPAVDTFRLANLWNTDIRVSKTLKASRLNAQIIADVFNILNSNTELVRGRNAAAASFDQLAQNLSPRILRLGVRIGF
jgi:hypothetical protein